MAFAGQALMDANAKEAANALLTAAMYKDSEEVRSSALECLSLAKMLPGGTFESQRPQILVMLAKAIDDPKRIVRSQACRTRQIWTS